MPTDRFPVGVVYPLFLCAPDNPRPPVVLDVTKTRHREDRSADTLGNGPTRILLHFRLALSLSQATGIVVFAASSMSPPAKESPQLGAYVLGSTAFKP